MWNIYKMAMSTPLEHSPQLTPERLSTISRVILDVLDEAIATASTDLDCAFTRGTLSWGRIRNALLLEIRRKRHSWLSLLHGGNDLVFSIGGNVVRFFLDDHLNPRKLRVLRPTAGESDQLKLFEVSDHQVHLWRFIVERASNEDEEHRVFFVGYNVVGDIVSKWEHIETVRTLSTLGNNIPAATELEPAELSAIYNDNAADSDEEVADEDNHNEGAGV